MGDAQQIISESEDFIYPQGVINKRPSTIR